MLTGQILAGEDIDTAVKYQQVIMFMICASSFMGAIMYVLIACRIVLDRNLILRLDRIYKPKPIMKNINSLFKR